MLLALIDFRDRATSLGRFISPAMIPIAAALFTSIAARARHDLAAINRAFFKSNAFVSAVFLVRVREQWRPAAIDARAGSATYMAFELQQCAPQCRPPSKSVVNQTEQSPARDSSNQSVHRATGHWHRYADGKAARFPNSSTGRSARRALCSPPSLRRSRATEDDSTVAFASRNRFRRRPNK